MAPPTVSWLPLGRAGPPLAVAASYTASTTHTHSIYLLDAAHVFTAGMHCTLLIVQPRWAVKGGQ
jgi:hypothetical protein